MGQKGLPIICAMADHPPYQFKMTSGSSVTNKTTFSKVECSEGCCIFGVRLLASKDGSFHHKHSYSLNQEARQWTIDLKHKPVTHHEAYTALNTMWQPNLSFTLAVTNFSKAQCKVLQILYTLGFLSKMSISSRT